MEFKKIKSKKFVLFGLILLFCCVGVFGGVGEGMAQGAGDEYCHVASGECKTGTKWCSESGLCPCFWGNLCLVRVPSVGYEYDINCDAACNFISAVKATSCVNNCADYNCKRSGLGSGLCSGPDNMYCFPNCVAGGAASANACSTSNHAYCSSNTIEGYCCDGTDCITDITYTNAGDTYCANINAGEPNCKCATKETCNPCDDLAPGQTCFSTGCAAAGTDCVGDLGGMCCDLGSNTCSSTIADATGCGGGETCCNPGNCNPAAAGTDCVGDLGGMCCDLGSNTCSSTIADATGCGGGETCCNPGNCNPAAAGTDCVGDLGGMCCDLSSNTCSSTIAGATGCGGGETCCNPGNCNPAASPTCGDGVDDGEQCGEPMLPACPAGDTCVNCVCKSGGGSSTVWPVTFTNPLDAESFEELIANVINWLLAIVGSIVLLFIIIAGIMYMTAAGDEAQLTRAKKMLFYTILGFAIILISYSLIKEIKDILGITS